MTGAIDPEGRGTVFNYAEYDVASDEDQAQFKYLPREVLDSDDLFLRVPVFNIEVEDFHTYYVGGKHGFWVHNLNCEGVRLANGKQA